MLPRLVNFRFYLKDSSERKMDLQIEFDAEVSIPKAFSRLPAANFARNLRDISSANFFIALSTQPQFINNSLSLPRHMLIKDLWINRGDKDSNIMYGVTTENAGHRHEYMLDYKGTGMTQKAYHPSEPMINHVHKVQEYNIKSAKSECYPNCQDLYGAEGAPPHVHRLAYNPEKRRVLIAKIDPSIVNSVDDLPRFQDSAGGSKYLIPISATFKDLPVDTNLTMFLVPFSSRRDKENDVPEVDFLLKKNILQGGKIVTSKKYYTTQNNLPTDIVERTQDGRYITSSGLLLEAELPFVEQTLPVREVIDTRSLKDTVGETSYKTPSGFISSKREKIPYFTDIFISRDSDEKARFLFGLDTLTYLKNNCAYPAILKDPQSLQSISNKINISSLKVVKKREGFERSSPQVVAETQSENEGGRLIPRTYYERTLKRKDKIGPNIPDTLVEKGSISETVFGVFNPIGVRYFSGIDISSAGDLQGTFSYTVSLEMLDPTVDMLKETLHKVQNLHGVFKDYYLRASQKRYNQVAKKFDEDFVIEFENKMKANITSALKEYVKHVSFLTHSNRRNLPWQDLYRMIHPRKSSPSLINEFLSIVGDNIHILEKDYDSLRSGPTNKSLKNTVRPANETFAQGSARLLRIDKTFETIYNANSEENCGQRVFDFFESGRLSLASVSKTKFKERRGNEFNKYFRELPTSAIVDEIEIAASPSNQYFSPLKVSFGKKDEVDCSHIPKDTSELREQNKIVAKISDYNSLEKIRSSKKTASNDSSFNFYPKRKKSKKTDNLISEVDEKAPIKGLDAGNVLRLNDKKEKYSIVADKIKDIATISNATEKINRYTERTYYDLRNRSSGIRIATHCPPDDTTLNTLPPQTKALIIANSTESGTNILNYSGDQGNFGWFYQNFINLYKVEVMTGYEQGTEGAQIKRPIFEPLTDSILNDTNTYLCRIIKETNKKMGRPSINQLDYPVYNQYFLLTPSGTPTTTAGATQGAATMTTTSY